MFAEENSPVESNVPVTPPTETQSNNNLDGVSISHDKRSLIANLPEKIDQDVLIEGFVCGVRKFKHHAFLVVRDRSGVVQTVVGSENLSKVPSEGSSVKLIGQVVNHSSSWGPVEVQIKDLFVISQSPAITPINVDRPPKETLEVQLDNRALSLRNPYVSTLFKLQAVVGHAFRKSMEEQGCVEIHTPKLVDGGTEGGAAVFSVNYFDRKVSLAQSPQLYKQIAAGALERVYEIAPVYRAENSHTSRHLTEFTGLDYEVSFIQDEHEVMDVMEHFIMTAIAEINDFARSAGKLIKIDVPEAKAIPRISYTDMLKMIQEEGTLSASKTLDKSAGDAALARFGSRLLFIYGYPTGEKPFYIKRCADNPEFTHSFDLLFDGLEISSGGQRINEYEVLVDSMRSHGLNPDEYPGYLQAFQYGIPPHGGAGLGLERVAQCFAMASNVRELTMFPRDVGRTSP